MLRITWSLLLIACLSPIWITIAVVYAGVKFGIAAGDKLIIHILNKGEIKS